MISRIVVDYSYLHLPTSMLVLTNTIELLNWVKYPGANGGLIYLGARQKLDHVNSPGPAHGNSDLSITET